MSNVGLVLSGGMAKGAYQIGALQAINEYLKPSDFKFVSSSSVGALNSYAYLTNGLSRATELWNKISNEYNRARITTILKSEFLQNAIDTIVSDVKISSVFYVPLVNLKSRTLSYVDLGQIPTENIELYLRASVAMPIYNAGVQIERERFFDGALIDNIPIYPLRKHKIDYIICIYFDDYNYTFENEQLDNRIIKLNFFDDMSISNSVCISENSVRYMIDEGYNQSKQILESIFMKGKDDIASIHSGIEKLNSQHEKRSLRITGDVVVNNMNKITKKLVKRKIIF